LLDLYVLALGYNSYAKELVSQAQGYPDLLAGAQRRVDEAKLKCEAACQALMKHREDHGC
jgi:hypothetical protein